MKLNLDRMLNILIVVILVIIIAICAVIIGRCSSKPGEGIDENTPEPETTATIGGVYTTLPPGNATPPSGQTSVPTLTPTEPPASSESPAPVTDVPLAVTEGDLSAVYARLEQLKQLKAEHPEVDIILLDVGHGGFDPGASGQSGTIESELNLIISRMLAEELANRGYYVFMTRMGEYAVADTKSADMEARTAMMKNDIFTVAVSIHMNSFPRDRSVSGVRVYNYPGSTRGRVLSSIVMHTIAQMTDQRERDTTEEDLMVVREPICPSVLVECGFLSNSSDEALLKDPEHQRLMAIAVACGVDEFIRGRN